MKERCRRSWKDSLECFRTAKDVLALERSENMMAEHHSILSPDAVPDGPRNDM